MEETNVTMTAEEMQGEPAAQVDAMFQALEGRVAEIKARFTPKKTAESKTFSFGTTE